MENEKFLIVAEKPSVANLIASALSVKKIKTKNIDYFEGDRFLITSASRLTGFTSINSPLFAIVNGDLE